MRTAPFSPPCCGTVAASRAIFTERDLLARGRRPASTRRRPGVESYLPPPDDAAVPTPPAGPRRSLASAGFPAHPLVDTASWWASVQHPDLVVAGLQMPAADMRHVGTTFP